MKYTIKGIEGLENFIKQHSVETDPRAMNPDAMIRRFFRESFSIKQGITPFEDGDTIDVEITEEGFFTGEKVDVVKTFIVIKHDSFLLKLVKV